MSDVLAISSTKSGPKKAVTPEQLLQQQVLGEEKSFPVQVGVKYRSVRWCTPISRFGILGNDIFLDDGWVSPGVGIALFIDQGNDAERHQLTDESHRDRWNHLPRSRFRGGGQEGLGCPL